MRSITLLETVDIDIPVYEIANQLDIEDFVSCFYCLNYEDREAILQEINGNGTSREVIKSLITTLERHGLHEMLIDLADLASEISHQTAYPVLAAIKQLERKL